jgi:sialidase-1
MNSLALSTIACFMLSEPDPAVFDTLLGGLRGQWLGPVTARFPRNGEGSTIRLKDGRLLHAFSRHGKSFERNVDLWPGVIAFTYSSDDGNSWTQPKIVFRNPDGLTAMQPSFVRLPNGGLGLSYSLIDSVTSARKVFRFSTDEGNTWSQAQVISPPGGYWTGAHDRLIAISGGRILAQLHTKLSTQPERLGTRIAYSDDSGRTWSLSPQTLTVSAVIPGSSAERSGRSGFHEASIAQRADGSLLMLGRTMAGRIYRSVSLDRGATWSSPEQTDLISGAAPARLARIPGSEDLMVVWNSCCIDKDDSVLGERLTLSSAISSDGGLTWKWRRTIADIVPGLSPARHWVDYPAITIDGSTVFLSYRAVRLDGQSTLMQNYMARLPLKWFYAAMDSNRGSAIEETRLVTADEINRAFAALPLRPPTNRTVHEINHAALKVARVEDRDGPREIHPCEDRIFYVTSGSARLKVENERDIPMEVGSVIIVPRGAPYQILATGTKIEFLVVRVK